MGVSGKSVSEMVKSGCVSERCFGTVFRNMDGLDVSVETPTQYSMKTQAKFNISNGVSLKLLYREPQIRDIIGIRISPSRVSLRLT